MNRTPKKPTRRKDWNYELSLAFAAPAPKAKKTFLKTIPAPILNPWGFFFTQLQYIRKRVWIFSFVILALCIGIVRISPDGVCWKSAALLPFLALTTATELAKSSHCNMAELEMGCKYNLSHILMARFLIFGISDLLLLSVIIGIVHTQSEFYFFRTALYLITPCMITAALSLWILQKFPRQESIYLCAAATGLISILNDIGGSVDESFYAADLLPFWGILFVSALCLLWIQCKKLLKKEGEEQLWNYI